MMLPSHVLIGAVLATLTTVIAPHFTVLVLIAMVIGSSFPDLDMVFHHRRTLHYPVYYTVFAVPVLIGAFVFPFPLIVIVAGFLIGAAVHSVSDLLGCGLESRPWEATDDRAVYDHYHGRWLTPQRVVPYDGSPQDLAIALGTGIIGYGLYTGVIQQLVVFTVLVAVLYTLVRKKLAGLDEAYDLIPTISV